MALQSSGEIKLSQIASEMGGSAPYPMSDYYKGGSYTTNYGTCPVPASGQLKASNFYGAKKNPCTSGTVDYANARCEVSTPASQSINYTQTISGSSEGTRTDSFTSVGSATLSYSGRLCADHPPSYYQVRKNGSLIVNDSKYYGCLNISGTFSVSAGDSIEIKTIKQTGNSGGATSTTTGSISGTTTTYTYFSAL